MQSDVPDGPIGPIRFILTAHPLGLDLEIQARHMPLEDHE